jgi:carbonic anhydrase
MACTICGRWVGDSAKAAGDRPHWTYEGPNGSDRWGQLDQSYLACGLGSQQSPVELAGAVRAELDPISIHWKSIRLDSVVNNGHTIQVNTPGAGYIELDGARFNLVQFHFHHMSEHTVEGKRYPIEVHFVHKAVSDDRLAVIGVFLVEGPENAVFNSIWTASPEREGEASSKAVIDATAMLPISSAAFRYAGSLTTPPCSEVVAWTVFNEPVSASADQIAFFAKQFPNNFRPTQPINRRVILFDG